jgi:L-ascorbate metabolism protein UlaG (beta-lactamase superfamily)
MSISRREALAAGAAAGLITVLPFAARAATTPADVFTAPGGEIGVHPVSHASFALTTPAGVIYVDPVGGAEAWSALPAPDLILITHRHGDHYDAETLEADALQGAPIITSPDVLDMAPEALRARASAIANGESATWNGVAIDAIPAHNLTEGRMNFHPIGRDNGYVLDFDGFRIYISGDTEDIAEMRALQDIDVAFVCMNLPFTMDAEAAAAAVAAFRPRYVYPYHYRGRDGGTQDPQAFARMVGDAAQVKTPDWYPDSDTV